MHKYVHSISFVHLYSIFIFYKMSLLWPAPSGVDLSVRLTEAFIQSAGISYTGCSATWQCEIIFTHRQLWLSGPRSAKKRFTQMAREREHGGWMMEGWFHHLLQASAQSCSKYFLSGLMCSRWHVCGPTWVWMHLASASTQRVHLSATHAACGSYIGIVRTQQGALFALCLPGAAFHPRWAGRQAGRRAGLVGC